ncbi:MAG: hypothetical protein AAF919_05245 [Pseudomonadota bacterium]
MRDGAATGLVLAQLDQMAARGKPVLWVQDRLSEREGGRPCLRGIELAERPILRVAARNAVEALWAMEEGLECTALSAVIGEIWGDPRVLDFTATKRLALRSLRGGVPLWLIRGDGTGTLSVAPDRWDVRSLPSIPNGLDARAPGSALWQAKLFRSRRQAPGIWVASHDRAAHRLHLAAPLRDGALGTGSGAQGTPRPRALG